MPMRLTASSQRSVAQRAGQHIWTETVLVATRRSIRSQHHQSGDATQTESSLCAQRRAMAWAAPLVSASSSKRLNHMQDRTRRPQFCGTQGGATCCLPFEVSIFSVGCGAASGWMCLRIVPGFLPLAPLLSSKLTLTQLPHTLHTHLTGTDSATDMQHDLKFVKTVFEPSWDDYVELEGCSGCVKVISWPFVRV